MHVRIKFARCPGIPGITFGQIRYVYSCCVLFSGGVRSSRLFLYVSRIVVSRYSELLRITEDSSCLYVHVSPLSTEEGSM